MKKLMFVFAVSVGLVSAAFGKPETLTTFTVNDGGTLEIGNTQGSDMAHNNTSVLIDLQGGATLSVTNANGKTAYLWSTLVCTNGPAVLQLDDVHTALICRYNVIVRAPGSLVVKSANCRLCSFGLDKDGNASNNFPHYDLAAITYADAEGNDVTANTTNAFYAAKNNYTQGVLLSMPNPAVTISVEAGKTLFLAGENMFPNQEVVAFDGSAGHLNVNAFLLNTNVFTATQKVTLGKWRTLTLKPIGKLDYATTHDRVWSSTTQNGYDFAVDMLDPNATVAVNSWYGAQMTGKISGIGTIRSDLPDNSSDARSTASFTGDLSSFTGSVYVSKLNTMELNLARIDGTTSLFHGSTLKFIAPSAGGPAEVDVAELAVTTTPGQPVTICAAAGQKVKLGAVSGYVKLVGDPEATTDAIDVAGASADGAALTTDGSTTVTFNGADHPAACAFSLAVDGGVACFLPNSNGEVAIPTQFCMPPSTDPTYYTVGEVKVAALPAGYGVKPIDGEPPPTFVAGCGADVLNVGMLPGTTAKLSTKASSWHDKALLWLDPSDETTVFKHYKANNYNSQDFYQPLTFTTGTDGNDTGYTVEGIADKRGAGKTTMRAWNGRSFQNFYKDLSQANSGYEELNTVFPFLSSYYSPVSGKSYLTFAKYSNSRRLQFVNFTEGIDATNAVKNYTSISPKFAVFVYGSRLGGGGSIFGENNGKLARGGTTLDDAILSAQRNVWLNGAKVDPTTAKFSGEWDVLSIDLSNVDKITGLGGTGSSAMTNAGGKYYGEIVFFSEVLTDAEREEVERDLAKGWGLLEKYKGSKDVAAQFGGSGTVEVEENVSLNASGIFSGTLSVGANAVVKLADGVLPYTEAQVSALNPALWVDPSQEGVITANGDHQVTKILQHDKRGAADVYLAANGTGRAPIYLNQARAFGPTLPWIDYNGTNEVPTGSNGNTLRMYTGNTGTADQSVNMKMGFIVQDSMRGGGTPFLDKILADGKVKARLAKPASYAMYETGTDAKLINGNVYLNGEKVDYKNGFTGGSEVFTFTATNSFPVGYYAYLGNSQGDYTYRYGEIQSEVMLFAEELGDADRAGVEAYLMKKWFGFGPKGSTDFSGAALDGTGTFVADNGVAAPKLASTFAGTFEVLGKDGDAELALTITTVDRTSTLSGTWNAPEATVKLPANVTIRVDAVGDRPRPGDYVLIDAANLSKTSFTLAGSLLGPRPDAKLVVKGNQVVLCIVERGTMMIFR